MALGLGLGRAPLVLPEVVAPEAVHRALDEDVVEDRVVAAVRLGVDVVDLPEAQFTMSGRREEGKQGPLGVYRLGMQVGVTLISESGPKPRAAHHTFCSPHCA